MVQPKLYDFSGLEIKPSPVRSATTETEYLVDSRPGHENCQCKFFKRYGLSRGPCRHILEKRLEISNKKLNYFEDRKTFDSRAFFDSVEQVASFFQFNNDPEFNHICTLWLAKMYFSGTAIADHIYYCLGGQFKRSAKILGTSINSLYKRKLAIPTGIRVKSQRSECHGRKIEQWKLTAKGKSLMEQIHRVA